MKRKTVVSAEAPLKTRTMTFRPKRPSPGRARALNARPKAEAPAEASAAPAPKPVEAPLPPLTEMIYAKHLIELDGELIEIDPFGSCTIAQALARAHAQLHSSGGQVEGIVVNPVKAFALLEFDAKAKCIRAKLASSASCMAIPGIKTAISVEEQRPSAPKHLELGGRRSAQHIYVKPPPPPPLYPAARRRFVI